MQVDTKSLYYAQNRYYNPQIGRFISEDPASFLGGFNPYLYCHGDPINFTDPLGLWETGSYWGDVGQFAMGEAKGLAIAAGFTMAMCLAPEVMIPLTVGMVANGVYKCGVGGFLQSVGDSMNPFAGNSMFDSGERMGNLLGNFLPSFCFTGDTLVLMADGSSKPIANIVPGDTVLSKSDTTGAVEAKTVLNISKLQAEATFDVTLSDGTTLHTTNDHPFFVDGKGWVKAGDLAQGNAIVTRAGPQAANRDDKSIEGVVRVVSTQRIAGAKTVHNLLVEDSHTYFVGDDSTGWKWVHNSGTCFHGETPAVRAEPNRIRTYNEPRIPGFDQHHLDPPYGSTRPEYPRDVIIDVRNDNMPRRVPDGQNFHTGADGFQRALEAHIFEVTGLNRTQFAALPNEIRQPILRRYYGSLGIPYPK